MTHTSTSTSGALPFPIPSGADVYDALMGEVEPELLTVNIPDLERKYANESESERVARFKRYEAAYAKYDAAFTAWISQLGHLVNDCRRDALKSAEQENSTAESKILKKIESSFTK